MKLVLQLCVALLEALQGPTLGLNISPLLERQHTSTHRMDGGEERKREGEERERDTQKNTLLKNPRHANEKLSGVREREIRTVWGLSQHEES